MSQRIALEITGKRVSASHTCAVCGVFFRGIYKAYLLTGDEVKAGGSPAMVHGSCISKTLLTRYIDNAEAATQAYYAARDRAEDKRQGLVI